MKISPDALARLAASQAAQGVAPLGGTQDTDGAAVPPHTATAQVGPVAATSPTARRALPPAGSGTLLTLSAAARQLSGPATPATLQWAHVVIETLTGLQLPPPAPRTPAVALPPNRHTLAAAALPDTTAPMAPPPPGSMVAPDMALFTAQGHVLADDAQEIAFTLQLFADRRTDAPHLPPVISTVLARMLASHPAMPPVTLRFSGPLEQLQSAVFEFQLEPPASGGAVAESAAAAGVRLLGLLVLEPQMEAIYDMHLATAIPRTDPASMLASMGFQQGKPPVGGAVWDTTADRLLCDDHRCPHFGEAPCPQAHCPRHGTAGRPHAPA